MTTRPPRMALLMLLAGVAGCTEPTLETADIPANFAFANVQPVTLTVSASAALLPLGAVGGLQIARSDGKTVYRGPLKADEPVTVTVNVPLADSALVATLTAGSAHHTANLSIAAGAAVGAFE